MSRDFSVPSFVYWVGAPFLLAKLEFQKRFGVLKPLERSILEAVVCSCSEPLASALVSQLSEINHALRVTAKSSEVNLFKIRGIRPDLSRERELPVASGDVVIAEVLGTVGNKEILAKVYAVDRRLFSIEFDSDVCNYLGRTDLKLAKVSIVGHTSGSV